MLADVERAVVVGAGVADGALVDDLRVHDRDRDLGLALVPVLLVKVSRGGAGGQVRVGELGLEGGSGSVELLLGEDTLSHWEVGSGQCLDLVVLQRAILVPEALGTGAS